MQHGSGSGITSAGRAKGATYTSESADNSGAPPSTSPIAPDAYENRKWSGYVDPGERVPVLRPRDKMLFWLHEEIQPASPLPAFISAGYSQLTNGDPKYGSNDTAFGERLGAALLRQASMRFFSDSLLPSLDHEDPRYYRKASGSYATRALHAVCFSFVDRTDGGRRTFNAANVIGHLAATALALTYYPQPSIHSSVVMRTWGVSVGGTATDNLVLEFWPDVVNKMHHRKP